MVLRHILSTFLLVCRLSKSHSQDIQTTKQTDIYRNSAAPHSQDKYAFPGKDSSGNPQYVSHIIDLASPVSGTLPFTLKGTQCCFIITLYCVTPDGIQTVNTYNASTSSTVKRIKNGVVVIEKDGKTYNAAGKQL